MEGGRRHAIVGGTVSGRAVVDPFRNLTAVDIEIIATEHGNRVTPAPDEVMRGGNAAPIITAAVAAADVVAAPLEVRRPGTKSRFPQRSPYREKHEGIASALHLGGKEKGSEEIVWQNARFHHRRV